MKIRTVGWLVGVVWMGLAGVLLVPLAFALLAAEPAAPFALAVATCAAGGGVLVWSLRHEQRALDHRSAFLAVAATWLSVCALGALPFATYPEPRLPIVDAIFESRSGFTTTGATVLTGLDRLPQSLLLWRSITQWLGGIGMVIFGVAILPLLGVGGMQLYKAEAPGPTKDKITPRIAETAKLLWLLYVSISVAGALLLQLAGMPVFDAVCHAMTAISTGGFSTHDASLGHYDSALVHLVTTLLMLAGGTSFAVLHRALTGSLSWSEQPELRAYTGIVVCVTLLITADLLASRPDAFSTPFDALRHAAFQTASILTTTGFATRDFDRWPELSRVALFALFLVGGMAGSTGGGIKVIRVLLMARLAFAQFYRLLHPRAVSLVRLGQRTIDDQILVSSMGFIGLWFALLGAGAAGLAFLGMDVLSALSAAAVTLGNIGPGLGAVGPTRTYAPFDPASKGIMTALMVLGRLEIYTVLVIFAPGFWRR